MAFTFTVCVYSCFTKLYAEPGHTKVIVTVMSHPYIVSSAQV